MTEIPHAGDKTPPARYYHQPYDKRYLDVIIDSKIDYVIWITPNRKMPDAPWKDLKLAYFLDVNKARKKPIRTIEYDYDKIICAEASET